MIADRNVNSNANARILKNGLQLKTIKTRETQSSDEVELNGSNSTPESGRLEPFLVHRIISQITKSIYTLATLGLFIVML
jgi:hypothetical protein